MPVLFPNYFKPRLHRSKRLFQRTNSTCATRFGNSVKPSFHQRISTRISASTCVGKWKLGRHKHKHKHKKNGQARSSCVCAYDYVVALTSENGVDISTSISTRPWTNHRSLWPRPHANISKAIWRTLRPPSCLSLGWGELVSRIESNMLFCACVYVLMLILMHQWKPGFTDCTTVCRSWTFTVWRFPCQERWIRASFCRHSCKRVLTV